MTGPTPTISAVITTIRRPVAAARAVASILASHHPRFELLVVDQNPDDQTSRAFGNLLADPRLRYLRSDPCGASAARNLGAAAARAKLIACTDDDCEVDPGWLEAMEQAFASKCTPDIVLGEVRPCSHDPATGFVPSCPRPTSRLTSALEERPQIEVMGACMGVRRSAWKLLDGFAEWIGPGTSLPAGEDYDLVVRALLGGHGVLETSLPVVIHHGFRTWTEGVPLIKGYTHGTALVLGMRLRGQPAVLTRCLAKLGWNFLCARSLIIDSSGSVAGPFRRMISFAQGLRRGLISQNR